MRISLAAAGIALALGAAAQDGKIVRPPNQSAIASEEVNVIATAPGAKLELDGKVEDILGEHDPVDEEHAGETQFDRKQ